MYRRMEKQDIRDRIWDTLEAEKVARFPFPPHGRIPNFDGAPAAADRLTTSALWEDAEVIKINPDSPQRPVRKRALSAGKTLYMAVPRLRDESCFLRLDPQDIEDIDHATTIGGAAELGQPVHPESMDAVDLIVTGSVAVDLHGGRIGKGEGYSDLEFAILREYGLVDDSTPIVTTVHDVQIIEDRISTSPTDVPLDQLCTPTRTRTIEEPTSKPTGIDWAQIDDDRLEDIPILQMLAPGG